jgi:hypothetical protein
MLLVDLVFLALILIGVLSILWSAVLAARGRFERSGRILLRLAAGAAIYMAVVILASAALPRRILEPDAQECFDDYCVGVGSSGGSGFNSRAIDAARANYEIGIRLHSRARRVSQRENNLTVYLEDRTGRRFDPVAGESLNVLLGPGESRTVRKEFAPEARTAGAGLVVTHEGGFPIAWFLIGYDAWFRKPAMFRLPDPAK